MALARSLLLGSALSLAALIAACSGAGGDVTSSADGGPGADAGSSDGATRAIDPAQIQMNDVSILLPLPTSLAQGDAYIKASDLGLGGELLPKDIYDGATFEDQDAGPAPGGALPMPHADLRVVAMRFDPCFANIGPVTNAATCVNQLRLVLQPFFQDQDGNVSALDVGVHAFYALGRDELLQMVSAVQSLRAASGDSAIDLGPLAVHPIIAREGVTGPFFTGLAKLVLAHAGASNFTRFTRIQIQGGSLTWTFSGFDVASGKATSMVIPALPAGTTQVSFFQGFADDLEGNFNPGTTSKDDMQLLGDVNEADDSSAADQKAAFDAALRIENPNMHSPNTIDCASCHLAAPARAITGASLGLTADGNANAFEIVSKFVPAEDLALTLPEHDTVNGVNVHVFSYKNRDPMIAPRAVNETAAIVDYLNGLR